MVTVTRCWDCDTPLDPDDTPPACPEHPVCLGCWDPHPHCYDCAATVREAGEYDTRDDFYLQGDN